VVFTPTSLKAVVLAVTGFCHEMPPFH